ncbi:site-specific DNA methylase [Synechococcus sp. PCC 7502]|uniref:DNA adenine methylase n=1 Tax=Synechococcus sp. PCC 7502 TaxID=1173263 RepID=UPI00029FF2B5|nr:DNA adenine methylase [Synechococcus sp. PCC 7502]AFY74133.1 site-specific DNA methylase [Synechococcus sp. PCC 7502]
MVTKSHIKSPLRYPGGKSKAIDQILPHIPLNINDYREPFVGGGSVFIAVNQFLHTRIKHYWINDLNYDLYCLWLYARDDIKNLKSAISEIKQKYTDGRELFNYYTQPELSLNEFDRAVRFFVLNRITFSGTVDSGGYSQQAFEKRFTDSSIDRLEQLSPCLINAKITNFDYEKLVLRAGTGVFLFLDPPYLSATKSRLYGKRGSLHLDFDHERFAANMRKCEHRWLITYDDDPEIRKLFTFAKVIEWKLQYGMNNYKQESASIGQELLIKNF